MTERNKHTYARLKSGVLAGGLALAIGLSALSPIGTTEKSSGINDPHSPGEYINLETGKIEYKLPSITSRYIWQLPQRTVSVNGKALSEPAVIMNGTLYLPLRAFANSIGTANVSYSKTTKTATLSMNGQVRLRLQKQFNIKNGSVAKVG